MSNVQANFRCKLWLAFPHCIKNSILDFYWLLSVPIKKPKQTKPIRILLDSKWAHFIEVCLTSQQFYPLYRKLILQPFECFSNNNNTVCTPGLSQTEYHFIGLLQDFQELFQVFSFQREKKKLRITRSEQDFLVLLLNILFTESWIMAPTQDDLLVQADGLSGLCSCNSS